MYIIYITYIYVGIFECETKGFHWNVSHTHSVYHNEHGTALNSKKHIIRIFEAALNLVLYQLALP